VVFSIPKPSQIRHPGPGGKPPAQKLDLVARASQVLTTQPNCKPVATNYCCERREEEKMMEERQKKRREEKRREEKRREDRKTREDKSREEKNKEE
jgi:hypothetical protein